MKNHLIYAVYAQCTGYLFFFAKGPDAIGTETETTASVSYIIYVTIVALN